MSSCSVTANNSSEDPLVLPGAVSSVRFHKPNATETREIKVSYEDGVLETCNTSSKPILSSTISSTVNSTSQNNGSLKDHSYSGSRPSTDFTCEEAHEDDSLNPEDKPISLCRFYQKNGFCRYKGKCKYAHPRSLFEPLHITQTYHRSIASYTSIENSNLRKNYNENGDGDWETKKQQICRFFLRNGNCRYGDTCRFFHQVATQSAASTEELVAKATMKETFTRPMLEEGKEHFENQPDGLNSITGNTNNTELQCEKVCWMYTRSGTCLFGTRCKFSHPDQSTNESIVNDDQVIENAENVCGISNEEQTSKNSSIGNIKRVIIKRPGLLRNKNTSDMTVEDIKKLRVTEIKLLKKRFSNCTSTAEDVFEVDFFPSDPDWRFDVKSVMLKVQIPEMYPKEILKIEVMNPDGILPSKLTRYLNKNISDWIVEQHKKNESNNVIQLFFRPFLSWFDHCLEDLFISGLKMVKRDMEAEAAGIQFVTHEELKSNMDNTMGADNRKVKQDASDQVSEVTDAREPEEPMPAFLENISSDSLLVDQKIHFRAMQETIKRGTQVKLSNLEFSEGAAAMTCSKLTVTVQCGRCKMRNDVSALPFRNHRIVCERCHHQQQLSFRSQMLHAFSAVAGYLDLENCQVVDVPFLTCEFALQCLPCGRQNLLTSIQCGQRHTSWCLFCNSKLVVFVEALKLSQLQPSIETVTAAGPILKIEKKEKRVKDPAIQEGKPLPDEGTCKHYKKSFRWLRFPCCGKAYPCDLCHDEKEKEHEMKRATRMICGFCAKEQVYSAERPCILCNSHMTKKSGTHWEGGKGCRDKTKMSKDDRQKFSGCNKTLSRKAQPSQNKKDK